MGDCNRTEQNENQRWFFSDVDTPPLQNDRSSMGVRGIYGNIMAPDYQQKVPWLTTSRPTQKQLNDFEGICLSYEGVMTEGRRVKEEKNGIRERPKMVRCNKAEKSREELQWEFIW